MVAARRRNVAASTPNRPSKIKAKGNEAAPPSTCELGLGATPFFRDYFCDRALASRQPRDKAHLRV